MKAEKGFRLAFFFIKIVFIVLSVLLPLHASYVITSQATLSAISNGTQVAVQSNPCQLTVIDEAAIAVGWNLTALPYLPNDPIPTSVFSGLELGGENLVRWDWYWNRYQYYDPLHPRLFGPCLTGEGYWLYAPSGGALNSSSGMPVTADHYTIPLPLGSMALIGSPYFNPIPLAHCRVLMNGQWWAFPDLLAIGYFSDALYWYNPFTLSYTAVDTASGMLYPWRGYWIQTPPEECWLVVVNPSSV